MSVIQQVIASFGAIAAAAPGQVQFLTPATHSWTVPDGVTSISCVLIQTGQSDTATTLTYASTIYCRAENGNRIGDGGNDGGPGGSNLSEGPGGGGGAAGYSGTGGSGGQGFNGGQGSAAPAGGGGGGGAGGHWNGSSITNGQSGGGTGLKGEGASGAASGGYSAGKPGSNGTTNLYGGGTPGGAYQFGRQGGALSYKNNIAVTPGAKVTIVTSGNGAARIIWGSGRAYPSTNTGDL